MSTHVLRPVLCLAALLAPLTASAQAWEQINDDDGVVVWQRDVPGTSLVEFRGRGRVAAPIQRVAAVIHNADREKEWMESCNGSATLEFKSALHAITYNRTASPAFLISDRDVVLETITEVHPEQHRVTIRFKNTEHRRMPDVDGVVRMPNLTGFWDLERVDDHTTLVTYQVQADPGGSIPKWLVNWASKSLPFDTVRHLRDQVKVAGYDHDMEILEMAIDWAEVEGKAAVSSATP